MLLKGPVLLNYPAEKQPTTVRQNRTVYSPRYEGIIISPLYDAVFPVYTVYAGKHRSA
jgi:hypothetical protein